MFGLLAGPWFYNNSAEKERRQRHRWFDNIPSNRRERIAGELEAEGVLPALLCKEGSRDGVSGEEQAASWLGKLSSEGPGASAAFCSVLDEVGPPWAASVLLDARGGLPQTALEDTPEDPNMRRASETDRHDPSDLSNLEGNSSLGGSLNHLFNRRRIQQMST